jgi:hypothetical protein
MKKLKTIRLAAFAAMTLALIGAGSASATTFEVSSVTQNQGVTFTLSLEAGTSLVTKSTGGGFLSTCTASHFHGRTENPYTATTLTAPITQLTFANCPRAVTVHNLGTLAIHHIAGSTNGTVYWEGTELTLGAKIFGYVVCPIAETTHVGTLTGVSSGYATLHVYAGIECSGVGSTVWEATYTVTSPEGLGFSA